MQKEAKEKKEHLSLEEEFLQVHLQPETSSSMIQNGYRLRTIVGFNNAICCKDEFPVTSIPLSIVPTVNPVCFGFTPPEGFIPINLACTELEVSK